MNEIIEKKTYAQCLEVQQKSEAKRASKTNNKKEDPPGYEI